MSRFSNALRGGLYLSLLCTTICTLVSCRSEDSKAAAEQAVSQFHSQFELEQYHKIYSEADNILHKQANETEFVAFLQAIHRKLGRTRYTHASRYQVGWFVGKGSLVTLIYETTYDSGIANEEFVWHIRQGKPLLAGYHISLKESTLE